jgi:hypothetical protein
MLSQPLAELLGAEGAEAVEAANVTKGKKDSLLF